MQIRYNAIRNGFWSGFNMKIKPRHDKPNKMICAPSEDSDQPGHPPSLIRVSAVRLKQTWALNYTFSAQRRLWSDWVDAQADLRLWSDRADDQADLSLRWAQKSFCWFCHLSWGGSKCFFLESTYAAHIHFITFFTFCIEPNMKSFSHANNIVLRRDIYILSLNCC